MPDVPSKKKQEASACLTPATSKTPRRGEPNLSPHRNLRAPGFLYGSRRDQISGGDPGFWAGARGGGEGNVLGAFPKMGTRWQDWPGEEGAPNSGGNSPYMSEK